MMEKCIAGVLFVYASLYSKTLLIIRRQMDYWDIQNQVRLRRDLLPFHHSHHSQYVKLHVAQTTY